MKSNAPEGTVGLRPIPWRNVAILFCVLFGMLGGVGGFTFIYADGLSYMGSDPKTCVNCHIMRLQYDS